MMRSLVFLSCVGAAIYALLVVTNRMMLVVPDGTKVEVVARDTRLKVWGPYLPDRPLKQLAATKQFAPPQQKIASRESLAARSPPATPDQAVISSSQIGTRLASFEARVPARDDDGFWFVVSRAAWLHDGPSVSSPIVHFYPVGTELRVVGHEQGWFRVLDPATSRTGWVYERHYLAAIPGPGQIELAVQQLATPIKAAALEPGPQSRIQKPRPKQKVAKRKRQQRIHMASAGQTESVASIMERAFRRN